MECLSKLEFRYMPLLLVILCVTVVSSCSTVSSHDAAGSKANTGQSTPATPPAVNQNSSKNQLVKKNLESVENHDLCGGLTTHKKRLPITRFKKPPYMKYYQDPAFGTTAIRITKSQANEVQTPINSSMQAWNADESLILLHRFYSGKSNYSLLDGHNYRFVRSLDIATTNIQHMVWSHTEPSTLFYISSDEKNKGWFMRYNVFSDSSERIRKFEKICGNSIPSWGNNVQMQSLDNDLFGFRCKTSSGHSMLTYRLSTDSVAQSEIGEGTPWDKNYAPMPAPSGLRLEMQGQVMAPQLDQPLFALDQAKFSESASLGRTSAGKDALFQTTFDPSPKGCNGSRHLGVAHLTEYNLESRKCRAVISEANGWPYTTKGTHVSAVGRHRPGWVAMSSIGYGRLTLLRGAGHAPALTSEIYLVNTDPDNTKLCRLAHHRTFGKSALNGDYPARFGQPHVTISPTGTRLLFGSDWYDSGSVDSYVIELPSYIGQ